MSQPIHSQTRELHILNQVAEALNSSPDVQQALERTLSLVADLLGLQTGWVWLVDPETKQFYNAAAQNLPPYLNEPIRMTGKSCWCLLLYQQGGLKPTNISLIECSRLDSPVTAHDTDKSQDLRYHACIPLYFQDKKLGIMNVLGPSWRKLNPEELRLLSTIAYQVGIAIERARLAEGNTQLARAEERTRIAREIHDTLAQDLTAIALQIEGAMPHLETDPERARQRLQRALTLSRESLEEARRSVLNLRGSSLAGKTLEYALNMHVRAFTSETGIRTRVRILGDAKLPSRIESELFRVTQEGLANVRRHSNATTVAIALRSDAATVRLVIHDNGRGFDTLNIPLTSHGITGMRERTALLGGQFRLLSRSGHGTTVAVTVPISSEGQS